MAVPLALGAGVYVSVPVDETAGATENSPALEFDVMTKETVCADSSAGPALIAVALSIDYFV